MIEVIVVCEGQTEERFVKDVLATHFGQQGVFLSPRVIHTSLRGRGGDVGRARDGGFRNSTNNHGRLYRLLSRLGVGSRRIVARTCYEFLGLLLDLRKSLAQTRQ